MLTIKDHKNVANLIFIYIITNDYWIQYWKEI